MGRGREGVEGGRGVVGGVGFPTLHPHRRRVDRKGVRCRSYWSLLQGDKEGLGLGFGAGR